MVVPTWPPSDPQFSQTFWNEFVHDQYEQPNSPIPLRRLTQAPMIYLKTVDEAGNPIDATTLQTVEDALQSVAGIWGGGQFGLAGVQRGTGTMEGAHGWYTVKWPNPSAGNFCGLTEVATDGGWIALNYLNPAGCGCNGSRMRTRTARHELGHAFGYWHTDSDSDLMRNGVNGCAEAMPSPREVYHATVAYQQPVGSTEHVSSTVRIVD